MAGSTDGGVVARGELASRRRHRSSSFIGHTKTRSSKDERVVVPPSFAAVTAGGRLVAPRYRADPCRLACDLLPLVPRRAFSRGAPLWCGRWRGTPHGQCRAFSLSLGRFTAAGASSRIRQPIGSGDVRAETRLASALERDAEAALGSVLDLRPVPLELRRSRFARRTRRRGWRGRRTPRSAPGSARRSRCHRRRRAPAGTR